MKKLFYILLFLTSFKGISQTFADKEYYLIDSLVLEELTNTDRQLIDSCLNIYHKSKNDTSKIKALRGICENMMHENWIQYQYYQYQLIKIALDNNPSNPKMLKNSLSEALNNIGFIYSAKGDMLNALKYYNKAVNIQQELSNLKGMASTYNNIGWIYNKQGNISESVKYYGKALKIQKKIGDKDGVAYSLINIGAIHNTQGDLYVSLDYYIKALNLLKEIGNKSGIASDLINIGAIYQAIASKKVVGKENADSIKQQKSVALNYYYQALNIQLEIGDLNGAATSYHNIGTFYDNETEKLLNTGGNTDTIKNRRNIAISFHQKALKIYENIGNKKGVINSLCALGQTELRQGTLTSARRKGERAFLLAQELGFIDQTERTTSLLYSISLKQAKLPNITYKNQAVLWREALEMRNLQILMKDSITVKQNLKAAAHQQAQYEYKKQKAIDDAQNERLVAIEKQEKEKQIIIIYSISLGLLLVIIFLYFVFNRLRITKKQKLIIEKQKHLVEEKNKEITDSITYAKRIQSAILPPNKVVKEYLQESFILYKPKDIVAGDFYWLEQVSSHEEGLKVGENHPSNSHQGEGLVLFAAADCTGHGVPGAMVSVICNNGLNRSVREHGLTDPGEILNRTREIVIEEFEKSEEDVKDGMDIALCSLTFKSPKLSERFRLSEGYATLRYAGANNPLWIVTSSLEGGKVGTKLPLKSSQGDKYLVEIKANKQPIGKVDNPLPYTTHTFELQQGDTIYIFSDGYVDQFGGEKGKKFKVKAFRDLLLSIQDKSMEEQKAIINETFEKWRGNLEQIDDVCIIGVRID